jgi:predicted TIM-barrel fold metal-dependent hydrolase
MKEWNEYIRYCRAMDVQCRGRHAALGALPRFVECPEGEPPPADVHIGLPWLPGGVRTLPGGGISLPLDSPRFGHYIDAHAHHSYQADMGESAAAWNAFIERNGIRRTIVSTLVLPGDETPVDYSYLDEETAALHGKHLDAGFFIPFTTGFDLEGSDDPGPYVRSVLRAPFMGVGELIIHGHGNDISAAGLTNLYSVAWEASEAVVPLLIHWDFGAVDSKKEDGVPTDTPGERVEHCRANFEELEDLANAFPNLIIILAHAGAGPGLREYDPRLYDSEADYYTAVDLYIGRLAALMNAHPNTIYIDFAGMVGICPDLWYDSLLAPSPLGIAMLTIVEAFPDRIFLGTDIEDDLLGTRDYDGELDSFDALLAYYATYVDTGDIPYRNALRLFRWLGMV